MSFQRARQQGQKDIRRTQIVTEAARQIALDDYSAVSMAQIASSLKLAKGTVFVYFPTKETLFLTVAELQFKQWFDLAAEGVVSCTRKTDVVDHLLHSLTQVPLLPKMISLLHGVLEHNVDPERILQFKRLLREQVLSLGASIDQRLSWHSGAGARGLLNLHTIIIGTYQMANPSPAVSEALKSRNLAIFRVNMEAQLETLLPLVFRNTKS